MKKIITVILLVCIVFSFSGCGSKENNKVNITNSEIITTTEVVNKPTSFSIGIGEGYELTKIEHSYPEIKEIRDISINKNLFITNDGSLYYISFDKLCSNNKYCIKIDTDIKFTKFYSNIRAEGLLSEDNELYDCVYTDNGWEFSKVEEVENDLIRNNIKKEDFQKAIYVPRFEDGKIHGRRICYVRDSYLEHFSNAELNFFDESSDKIEWYVDNTIKINGDYYAFYNKQTNTEECSKYADVKPIYETGFHKIDMPINDVLFFKYIEYTDITGNGYCVVIDSEGSIYIKQ